MANNRPVERERIHFYDGDLLTAQDLQDHNDYESWLRGLHMRGLHQTWGLALGFRVELSDDRRQVMVGPGLAYDCWGREILLAKTISLDGPPPAGSAVMSQVFDLAIRYTETACLVDRRWQASRFSDGGIGQAEERPEFRWFRVGDGKLGDMEGLLPEDLHLGADIPLGRFEIDAAGKLVGTDRKVQRHARPLLRPHIAYGVTKPGELEWDSGLSRHTAVIPTSPGGFGSSPFYFVKLIQNPWFEQPDIEGPFISIVDPQPTQFKLQIFLTPWTHALRISPAKASFFWVGVEPVTGCAPVIDANLFFSLMNNQLLASITNWSIAIAQLNALGLIIKV